MSVTPDHRSTTAVEFFAEARQQVFQGLQAELPARKSLRKRCGYVDEMLEAALRQLRGEITLEESTKIFDEVRADLPDLFPPRPSWLEPSFASGLVDYLRCACEENPNAPDEFIEWLRREFARPCGAPIKKELEPIYKQAAVMHMKGSSWRRITRDLCPLRKADDGHQCDKYCEDRMRQGAKEYL